MKDIFKVSSVSFGIYGILCFFPLQAKTENVPGYYTELYINSTDSNDNITAVTDFDYVENFTTDIESVTETVEMDITTTTFHHHVIQESQSHVPLESICSCDLSAQSCDIDCCCDEDCSDEDVKVFTGCSSDSNVHTDKRYCYRENIFYKNNTVYKGVTVKDNSMFCIIVDNMKERLAFKNIPSFNTSLDMESIHHKLTFSWSIVDGSIETSEFEPKKAGDLLYIIPLNSLKTDDDAFPWSMPSECFGAHCDCIKPIRYMEDTSSSCIRSFHDLRDSCESLLFLSVTSYTDFCFQMYDSVPDGDVNYVTNRADVNENCVLLKNIPTPVYDSGSETCNNVVNTVHYDVVHGGIHGLHGIHLNVGLTSLTLNSSVLLQKFSVSFTWNQTQPNSIFKRSGNPGYRVGYPVLSGTGIEASSNNTDNSDTVIANSVIGLQPLSVIGLSSDGYCSDNRRFIVFGKNMKTGCLIRNSFLSCNAAKEKIYEILMGNIPSVYVGAFGNSNASHREEWVEIFSEGKYFLTDTKEDSRENCEITLDLQISIAFAAVGPLVNPQFKIVGVLFKYSSPQTIILQDKAKGNSNDLYTSTSVHFFDVSKPAVSVQKKFPVFDFRLPHDFFYPFLLSTSHVLKLNIVSLASQLSFAAFMYGTYSFL